MNAARDRLQVYKQEMDSDQEISELLHDCELEQGEPAPSPRSRSVPHMSQNSAQLQPAMVTQAATEEQTAINTH